MVARTRARMATQAVVIVDEILDVDAEDELRFDRLPGMPLVGFFTGAAISMALWGMLGYIAWHLVA